MKAPAVAVVVTCDNQGRSLARAVQSVLDQSAPAAELVIADGGSTDLYTCQSLAHLERAGKIVVRASGRGVSAARNLGVQSTTAPYIVVLDADDVLEPRWLEMGAGCFEREPSLAFVSGNLEAIDARDTPRIDPCLDLVSSMARGAIPMAAMFRRSVWVEVGGFDEALAPYDDVDFWTSVLERGLCGRAIDEPLLRYGRRPTVMYRAGLHEDAHVRLMERFFVKHRLALDPLGAELVEAKERFLVELRERSEQLQGQKSDLEAELHRLHLEISQTLQQLRPLGGDRVEFGDLRRTSPISPVWGIDRGIPLDRYYIHSFLERHRSDVRGRVLEIKELTYTRMFGDDRVTAADILDVDADNADATIVADLARADAIAADTFDCFILTQTLAFIFDVQSAIAHACRILKPGGVLLCTVPASGRISYEPPALDGDYWRFTEASMRHLFASVLPVDSIEITGYGNVLARAAFLYGLAPEELTPAELDVVDPFFPVAYGVRVVKPDPTHADRSASVHTSASAEGGAVLMYHRTAVAASDPCGMCIAPEEFRAAMQHLVTGGYTVLALPELVAAARAGRLPPRAVAITLDDGYLDNLTSAAEILRDCELRATFFIVGAPLDADYEFWWDRLARILLQGGHLPPRLSMSLGPVTFDLPTGTEMERADAFEAVRRAIYMLPLDDRDGAIQEIVGWGGASDRPPTAPRAMTASELRQLAAMPGVEIGSHTERHLWLPAQREAVVRYEIGENKRRLEAVVGRAVTSFSYPHGGHDARTVAMLGEMGFEVAVTTQEQLFSPRTDPMRVPRYDVRQQSETSGFAPWLDHLFR
ncbi:MAG: polysaccharide deacetylase family protein [Acidobacteria bacterium]|nr:polysaccharide deacetylase family protein [Acidobacteriota bacterium]